MEWRQPTITRRGAVSTKLARLMKRDKPKNPNKNRTHERENKVESACPEVFYAFRSLFIFWNEAVPGNVTHNLPPCKENEYCGYCNDEVRKRIKGNGLHPGGQKTAVVLPHNDVKDR